MISTIGKSQVFEEIKRKGQEQRNYAFAIKYCRTDVSIGKKERVCKIFVGQENAILNRTVNFCNLADGKAFKIGLDFWIEYNGKIIDHTK